ncbi:MAG: hypothetical protein D6808_05995 [Candidatus Dadabacteria bacterium]|nr:MAG: hypothetical protein D6808_05995 [Candidatus Dadabacteria bacterium]
MNQTAEKLQDETPNRSERKRPLGLVLSGGGSRAAYQAGALKALCSYLEKEESGIEVIVGSSIGAVNALVVGATLKGGIRHACEILEKLWLERTFKNSFAGSPSRTFLRSVKITLLKYAINPEPSRSKDAIFDPSPLIKRIDEIISQHGGLSPESRDPSLKSLAVMTTIEGPQRKPLLFVSSKQKISKAMLVGASFDVRHVDELTAKHGFASAALPTVLPPVSLNIDGGTVTFVDGGISQNVPVDPAVRLGGERVIILDISGRAWWFDKYGEPHDKRPDWEVPAEIGTFCLKPPKVLKIRNGTPFGPLLKEAVGKTTRDFIGALGATWPVYTLLKQKLGEELAYEVMSYVALHPEYARALIEAGYNETMSLLKDKEFLPFRTMKKEDLVNGD